jgi:SAM-dependent methyltransferase
MVSRYPGSNIAVRNWLMHLSNHSGTKNGSAESYSRMAEYYDAIYSKLVNYELETRKLEKIIATHQKKRVRSILDVACGTGNYSFVFAKRGYKTVGVDISKQMISVAKKKAEGSSNPRFFAMDMRNIELKQRFDVATVLFGGFGYLLEKNQVLEFLSSVRKRLFRDGLLVFEFWHDSGVTPASAGPSGYLSWNRVEYGENLIIRLHKSNYSAETGILAIEFTHFVFNLGRRKIIDHFVENHTLKTYSIPEVKQLLEESGFFPLSFYDNTLGSKIDRVKQSTFRVTAVATPSFVY